MVEKILLILLGIALSGIGYFVKRFIEKKQSAEVLERHQKLLTIRKELSEQKLSVEDLRNLEHALLAKNSKAAIIEELQEGISPIIENEDGEFLSQAELNMRAGHNLKIAEAQLEKVYNELLFKVEGNEGDTLKKSQSIWKKYSVAHSKFSASGYEGGTIYPLIYLSTLESLVIERTALLQSELDEIRRLREI
jgi:uncharacterized protein YecT (DUF1311 family)